MDCENTVLLETEDADAIVLGTEASVVPDAEAAGVDPADTLVAVP